MATKSFADLQAEIQKLQAQANALREQEKAGVVARIREAISAYELTERDLFGRASRGAAPKRGRQPQTRAAAYADGTGNVWGGRGPRPKWLRDALQQGKSLEDFATGGRQNSAAGTNAASAAAPEMTSSGETASGRGRQPAAKRGRKAAGKSAASKAPVKFRDESGNTWSGRGLQPKWLKDALANGSSLESFQVPA